MDPVDPDPQHCFRLRDQKENILANPETNFPSLLRDQLTEEFKAQQSMVTGKQAIRPHNILVPYKSSALGEGGDAMDGGGLN